MSAESEPTADEAPPARPPRSATFFENLNCLI